MILVTGATGLLGAHICHQLLKKGEKVRALKRSSSNLLEYQLIGKFYQNSKEPEWFETDLLDVYGLDEALQGITKIYHCAAIVSFWPKRKFELIKNNAEGTANLINAAIEAKVKRIVYASSVAAIGRPKYSNEINEDFAWLESENNSGYAISKYLAEMEVWRGVEEGLEAVIVNPSMIIGAGLWNKGALKLIKQIYNGFPFYSDGTNAYIDAEDVAKIMIELDQKSIINSRFILCSENLTYQDFFNKISKIANRKAPYIKVQRWMAEIIWRLSAIKSWFDKKEPFISKETARISKGNFNYNNKKIKETLPVFNFKSIDKSIEECIRLNTKSN